MLLLQLHFGTGYQNGAGTLQTVTKKNRMTSCGL